MQTNYLLKHILCKYTYRLTLHLTPSSSPADDAFLGGVSLIQQIIATYLASMNGGLGNLLFHPCMLVG